MRITVLLALSVLVSPALADKPRKAARDGPAQVLRQLALTADQGAALVVLARQADRTRVRYHATVDRVQPRFLEPLLTLREEVALDQGLLPETMKRANDLKKQLKLARTTYSKRLAGLERKAAAVLTPVQRRHFEVAPREPREWVDDPELAKLRREIVRIHAEQYGEVGRLGRWLAQPATFALLEGRKPVQGASRRKAKQLERELARLRKQINLWNLMNGLHLTAPQLRVIATAADGSRGAVATGLVLAALGEEQQDVLHTYKSCLVPPRNLRDPVRAGQAVDSGRTVRLLTRMRKIPSRRYDRDAARIHDATLAEIERREGSFTKDERRAALRMLAATVRKARALDEVTFQVQLQDLAAGLEPLYRLHELKDELAHKTGKPELLRAKTAKFLLDPAIAPLCRRRIEQLKRGIVVEASGEIGAAEQCGESCGRP